MPEDMEANRDAIAVFLETKTQVIVGFDSIIDINMLAVKMEMDLRGITNQLQCKAKVRVLFNEYKQALEDKRDHAKS
jgi:hypothetical protein